MKRLLITTFLLALIVLFAAAPARAQAESFDFHVSFGTDVAIGSYRWNEYEASPYGSVASLHGNPVPSIEGEYSSGPDGFGFSYGTAAALITLPEGCDLIDITWDSFEEDTYSTGGIFVDLWLYDEEMDTIGSTFSGYAGGPQGEWTTNGPVDEIVDPGADARYLEVNLRATIAATFVPMEGGEVALDNVHFTCEGIEEPPDPPGAIFWQPIQESEQIDVFTPVDEETDEILAASRITAAAVYSTDDLKLNSAAVVQVYSAIPGVIGSVVQTTDSLYAVRIDGSGEAAGFTATYSNLSTVYVLPGDTVEGGCVIGVAGPQFAAVDGVTDPSYKQIIFSVAEDDPEEELGILQDWTVYADPHGSEVCGSLLRYEDCINNNPKFEENGSAWSYGNSGSYTDNAPERGPGFVMLLGGQYASQEIWLPVMETYYVTVASTPQGPDATLSVQLGDMTIDQVITPTLPGTTVITEFGPYTGMEPSAPGHIYTLAVTNEDPPTAPYGTYVNFVCMHIDGADSRTPPAACYFSNPKFDEDDSWVLAGGASIESALGVGGFLSMPLSSTASQGVYLYAFPAEPGQYRVTISARQEGLIADIGGDTILSASIDSPALDDTATFNVHNTVLMKKFVHEFEVDVGDVADGDYILEVTDLDAGVDSIQIGEVCLEPVGGQWPGYGNSANKAPTCDSCSFPGINLDPTIWLAWLGCLFTSFVCKIPAWIAIITAPMTAIFNFLGLIGRWFAVVGFRFGVFLQSLISSVVALLSGVLIGAINGVWAALNSLPLIQEIVDRFGLAEIIAAAITGVIFGILASILSVIQIMASFAQIAGIFLAAMMDAVNGTSTVDTGMPVCASLPTEDALYPLCMGLDLVDLMMTVFPALNAWIYAAIGVLGYFTATHIFARVGQTFGDVS
jgi:hypothetical protein